MQSHLDQWLKHVRDARDTADKVAEFGLISSMQPDTDVEIGKVTVIQSDSDDNDGPVSRGTRQLAVANAKRRKVINDATPTPSPPRVDESAKPHAVLPSTHYGSVHNHADAVHERPTIREPVLTNGIAQFPVWSRMLHGAGVCFTILPQPLTHILTVNTVTVQHNLSRRHTDTTYRQHTSTAAAGQST